jgi:hypothetical protein
VERQCGAHKCGGGEKRVTEMLRGKVGTSVQYFLDVRPMTHIGLAVRRKAAIKSDCYTLHVLIVLLGLYLVVGGM